MKSIQIGSYEAKTKLPEILRRVQAGESFTITNRGKAIAELIPTEIARQARAKKAVEAMQRIKKTRPVSDEELKKMINQGRD
ncbi:MAG: type II toxin-antitoxin system Phd/YefM family antitoxin [Gammaproteobacteria bacterium]